MTATSSIRPRQSIWQTVVISILAFWLSSSLLLDLVIMPSLYAAGMMDQTGFATAGYSIFWVFNHIELFCASLALTGLLVLRNNQALVGRKSNQAIVLSLLLIAIAGIYTYVLAPEMSALGLQLNLFESVAEVPTAMDQLHQGYWVLELCKLVTSGALLGLCYRN